MAPIIDIQNISKKYSIRAAGPYLSLRDQLSRKFRGLWKSSSGRQEFWALKDINLQVGAGERLGVIGRNGAGKSTLLKIISRITPPTSGMATIEGRVASLLEVGTGFHPELTGRENIYFNGSVLGLKRAEINQKFDEIVAFSGIEAFIDTPLKQYSSGMQLRLAFSVAAHMDPEVLLIDEVLAVGDIEFQQKCIGKMEEISRREGRTIVFISHNMAAVKRLCNRAAVLSQGELAFTGGVTEAIDYYSDSYLHQTIKTGYADFNLRQHPNKLREREGILAAALQMNGQPSENFIPGNDLQIDVRYFLEKALIDPDVGLVIKDAEQNSLIGLNSKHLGKKLQLVTGRESTVSIVLPQLNLFKPGRYRVNLYFGDNYNFYECLYDAFEFQVPETDVYNSGLPPSAEWNQIFLPKIDIIS